MTRHNRPAGRQGTCCAVLVFLLCTLPLCLGTGCVGKVTPFGRELLSKAIEDVEAGQRNYDRLGAAKEMGDYRNLGDWAETSETLETLIARSELPDDLAKMLLLQLLPKTEVGPDGKVRKAVSLIKADGQLTVFESLEIQERYRARMRRIEVGRHAQRAQVMAGAGFLVRAKRRMQGVASILQAIERRVTAEEMLRKTIDGGGREAAIFFEGEAKRELDRDSERRIREAAEAAAKKAIEGEPAPEEPPQ